MSIKISVVVPTFNRTEVLCDTLEMLIDQTAHAHEIIIVDQSTQLNEQSKARLKGLVEANDIRWIHQTEANASMARNRGAAAATGDVLLFLDDDVRLVENLIESHAKNYENPEVLGVAGQILDDDSPVVWELPQKTGDPEVDWLYFPKNYGNACETPWMASGNFSVRRQTYWELGGMDETYWKGGFREEADFGMRFLRRGYRFRFDPNASLFHLGIKSVPAGGSRPHDFGFGMWHHIFGAWYFIVGYGTLRSTPILLVSSFRGFVLNRSTLKSPSIFFPRLIMWFAGFPAALWVRLRNGFRVSNSFQEKRNQPLQ